MTYIKLNDGQYEVWPETQLDALQKLGTAMVHCGIYDLDKFYYEDDWGWKAEHIKAYDTPVGRLNLCLRLVIDDLRYGRTEQVAA